MQINGLDLKLERIVNSIAWDGGIQIVGISLHSQQIIFRIVLDKNDVEKLHRLINDDIEYIADI